MSAARIGGISLLRLQSDERLAQLVREGSDEAFDVLVRRYRRELMRSCRRILPEDRAEDAVQQALLDAHQALRRNGTPDRFRSWLHRIAVNAALKIAGDDGELAAGPLDEEEANGLESPERARERRERLRRVVGAIQALPGRQRQALVLRELEGRSHGEIARELGLSGGAVRQLIHRARNAVRSAASALIPPAFLLRLLTAGGGAAPRIGETAGAPEGTGTAAKLAIAVVVAGGVAGGVAVERNAGDRPQSAGAAESRGSAAGEGAGGDAAVPTTASDGSGAAHLAGGGGGGSGNSVPGSGNSGPGSSSSGPGSGSGEDGSGSRSSGPGSGEDEPEEFEEDDSSGSGSSGSYSSGSGSSGSGTSGSGSSGSDSSGSGSLSSGSSGSGSSGSSGSGSSGSGSGDLDDD